MLKGDGSCLTVLFTLTATIHKAFQIYDYNMESKLKKKDTDRQYYCNSTEQKGFNSPNINMTITVPESTNLNTKQKYIHNNQDKYKE